MIKFLVVGNDDVVFLSNPVVVPKEYVSLIKPSDFALCGFQKIECVTKTKNILHLHICKCTCMCVKCVLYMQIHIELSTKCIRIFKRVTKTRSANIISLISCGKLLANITSILHKIMAVDEHPHFIALRLSDVK